MTSTPRDPDDDAAARQLRELEGIELQSQLPLGELPDATGRWNR